MNQLIAARGFHLHVQHSVPGIDRAVIPAIVERRRMDLRRRPVPESVLREGTPSPRSFLLPSGGAPKTTTRPRAAEKAGRPAVAEKA